MTSKGKASPSQGRSWRAVLPIHPAAELFPLMSPDELRELGEDIKKNGLKIPVTVWRGKDRLLQLLDGRNRLDAMEAVGIPVKRLKHFIKYYLEGPMTWEQASECIAGDTDPYEYAISANIRRRHLSAEQQAEMLAKLVAAQPEKSDRELAKQAGVSHPTIAKARRAAEATGKALPVEKRVGADGRARARPSHKATKPGPKNTPAVSTKPRDDIGPASAGEIARRDAEIEELRNAKRHLETKITELESEIEDLRGKLASGTGGDMSISEFQTAIKKWEDTVETQRSIIAWLEKENAKLRAGVAAPPPDDGLDIPDCLRRDKPKEIAL